MFEIDDITSQRCWNLSHPENEENVEITEKERKKLQNFDLLAINFLYQNFRKKYKGAILNEQVGCDMQLQVVVFLNIMFRHIEQKFLNLVVAPEYLLKKWDQLLTELTTLQSIIVNSETCPQDFDDKHGVVLVISFSDLKLLEHLIDYSFFSITIDCFDEIAKKPTIKKLSGDFHIGLTTRNFYMQPDQKLQWSMLDWCSPDCCGKSKMFCKVDNENFANFRNNYRHWWFRLTRHFCESLEGVIGHEEPGEYKNVTTASFTKNRKRTIKKSEMMSKKVKKGTKPKHLMQTDQYQMKEIQNEENLNMNNEIIKMETLSVGNSGSLNDNDEEINLLPIWKNQDNEMEHRNHENKLKSEELSASIAADIKMDTFDNNSGDFLYSLIGLDEKSSMPDSNPEKEILLKKQELSSQIFAEQDTTSRVIIEKESNSDILLSLID